MNFLKRHKDVMKGISYFSVGLILLAAVSAIGWYEKYPAYEFLSDDVLTLGEQYLFILVSVVNVVVLFVLLFIYIFVHYLLLLATIKLVRITRQFIMNKYYQRRN